MERTAVLYQPLSFRFTEDGFFPDVRREQVSPADGRVLAEFEQDRFLALYHLGLRQRQKDWDASAQFLYLLSDAFFKRLTDLPDLELLRENAIPTLEQEDLARLIQAVPFAIGAEYVTEDWIRGAFLRLGKVFSREIQAYDGSVSMYLAEQTQHLRVPERIFFHLVENKDGEFPFAFLATFLSSTTLGHVTHLLSLQEYQQH